MDIINDGDCDLKSVGTRIILPATYHGGPRYMQKRYQNAMAIVRVYGKPTLFITFTCNPNWKEIQEELLPRQISSNRPDMVVRVFNLKLKALLHDLLENNVLGKVIAYIYVTEFQKRGLPHAHILLIMDQHYKLRTPDEYDRVVSAELPSMEKSPNLFALVKQHMIHKPCGILAKNNTCMIDGACSKRFPKSFCNNTSDSSNGYPLYKRRNPENGGNKYVNNQDIVIDNCWVVVYNP